MTDCHHSCLQSIEVNFIVGDALIYPSIKIGDSSIVSAGSVVMRHVKEGQTVMGNPAKKVE